ncbi:histone promoter control 2 [Lindgomyces ingoldianus]|uniref:Histone promoter control 2 n=1 Tax=Lindgomyces ingoldianus TaxID=673940 RepID=A0ACB6QTJ5_9PLEO|nr:histone promoter control 2 [Lindgomyces ingoldianus]KAF2470343.1 histone promoter control 2 [Lindgomyces ingoldianus]
MDLNEVPSSPGSLSSPPHSPDNAGSGTIRVAGVGVHSTPNGTSQAASTSTPKNSNLTASGQPRKKPGPKPKPKDPNAPEKKPRKPRRTAEPKDVSAEPAPRKRRGPKASLEAQAPTPPPPPVEEKVVPQQLTPTPQTRPTEMVSVLQQEPPAPIVTQPPRVLNNPEPIHNNPSLAHISVAPSTPRPASSGQRYDPIRGGVFESKPPSAASAPPVSPPLNRASASPSITSLIDPPSASNSTYPQAVRLQHQASITSAPVSPAALSSRPGSVLPQHDLQPSRPNPTTFVTTPMEIDSDANSLPKMSVPMKKTDSASAGTPSNAPTPPVKPARQKEAPPPLPTGSGLLSGTPFGPMTTSNGSTDSPGVNIWLSFPLKGQTNVTINFAQEVEKKYGFAALHPRIAARRERQRQITAAGAALEKATGGGSNDDMSLDLSEPESNVEMGGMDDEASAGNGGKRKRKRKQEDYDKEDDFIDDTELAWEQQALMAKDGFFVYSGPLLPEGEKPAVERADGTVKRGRGRGRGGTVRGEASGRGRGRGGGPGSRGGSTVRKPRVTKADRAMMEQEKHEREKMAATIAAKQPIATYAGAASM